MRRASRRWSTWRSLSALPPWSWGLRAFLRLPSGACSAGLLRRLSPMSRAAPTPSPHSARSFCSEDSGQASVEAALLLPVLMVCLALLVQPMCLLYTRCVMQSAAAEGCRLLATATGDTDDAACEQYVRRRLSAVPQTDVFLAGDWQVELQGKAESDEVGVQIVGHARPLPLVGVVAALLGPVDQAGNVELKVSATRCARAGWVEGGYSDWTSIWGSA